MIIRDIKAEPLPGSGGSIKPNVLRRFRFEYSSCNVNYILELDGSSLNDTMIVFATHYHFVDRVDKIFRVR